MDFSKAASEVVGRCKLQDQPWLAKIAATKQRKVVATRAGQSPQSSKRRWWDVGVERFEKVDDDSLVVSEDDGWYLNDDESLVDGGGAWVV
ncbi:hypothetical protein L1887_16591 [Cichorium endivia]|nr:hypothetical protein L1887_16591 [Cichorium endivia]